jgi:hypothetical protein
MPTDSFQKSNYMPMKSLALNLLGMFEINLRGCLKSSLIGIKSFRSI